jgi:adenylate cyclase
MTEDFKRKLAAILSADVVGYSRLMGDDEESTVRTLNKYKELIFNLIEKNNGRVIDSPGDNVLAEFVSVVDAVRCGVQIQEDLKANNEGLPENRKMEFRIGINIGDVIQDGDRIYGDGVNVAARIESLADPGGICISRTAYDQVKKKMNIDYEDLGEYEVKNIDEPVRVYRIRMEPEAATTIVKEKKAGLRTWQRAALSVVVIFILGAVAIWYFSFRQAPITTDVEEALKTIAILPFDNLSSDPEQVYFADGLSEEILNSLCQIPDLGVAGKTSSFSFQDKDKTIQEIASVLGVDHILEGSVRKAGDALRITAQLVRASDGLHLWSKTYDRELKDIFEVQEDIANSVADELKVTLGIGKSLKQLGGTNNEEAYELYLVAKGQYNNLEYNRALESIDVAIELDPGYAVAWAWKVIVYLFLAGRSPADRASLEIDAAFEAALRAIELEPSLGKAYLALGWAHLGRDELIEAELAYRKGMDLTTESIDYFEYGLTLHYASLGYLRKCNEIVEELRRNDPLHSVLRSAYMYNVGLLGDIQGAEKEYERGKAIFGDQWIIGDFYMAVTRLGAKDVLSINDIPEVPIYDPIWAIAREHIESPEKGLAELRRLFYADDNNLSSNDISTIWIWAAYFGDPEFALDTMERYVNMYLVWAPLFHEVRQLPRFKEFVSEIGFVDYWNKFGWPDICHPVGDNDFVCD